MLPFKTEMLWMHPPRHPPRPARYGHLRRRNAPSAPQAAAAARNAIDASLSECRSDALVRAPLDRAA